MGVLLQYCAVIRRRAHEALDLLGPCWCQVVSRAKLAFWCLCCTLSYFTLFRVALCAAH